MPEWPWIGLTKIRQIFDPNTSISTSVLANAVYRRKFDDVFVVTSAEKSIRRDVFALYSGENTSDVLL